MHMQYVRLLVAENVGTNTCMYTVQLLLDESSKGVVTTRY